MTFGETRTSESPTEISPRQTSGSRSPVGRPRSRCGIRQRRQAGLADQVGLGRADRRDVQLVAADDRDPDPDRAVVVRRRAARAARAGGSGACSPRRSPSRCRPGSRPTRRSSTRRGSSRRRAGSPPGRLRRRDRRGHDQVQVALGAGDRADRRLDDRRPCRASSDARSGSAITPSFICRRTAKSGSLVAVGAGIGDGRRGSPRRARMVRDARPEIGWQVRAVYAAIRDPSPPRMRDLAGSAPGRSGRGRRRPGARGPRRRRRRRGERGEQLRAAEAELLGDDRRVGLDDDREAVDPDRRGRRRRPPGRARRRAGRRSPSPATGAARPRGRGRARRRAAGRRSGPSARAGRSCPGPADPAAGASGRRRRPIVGAAPPPRGTTSQAVAAATSAGSRSSSVVVVTNAWGSAAIRRTRCDRRSGSSSEKTSSRSRSGGRPSCSVSRSSSASLKARIAVRCWPRDANPARSRSSSPEDEVVAMRPDRASSRSRPPSRRSRRGAGRGRPAATPRGVPARSSRSATASRAAAGLLGRDLGVGPGQRPGQVVEQAQPRGDDRAAAVEERLVPEPELVARRPAPRGSRGGGCSAAGASGRRSRGRGRRPASAASRAGRAPPGGDPASRRPGASPRGRRRRSAAARRARPPDARRR